MASETFNDSCTHRMGSIYLFQNILANASSLSLLLSLLLLLLLPKVGIKLDSKVHENVIAIENMRWHQTCVFLSNQNKFISKISKYRTYKSGFCEYLEKRSFLFEWTILNNFRRKTFVWQYFIKSESFQEFI